MSKQVIAEIAEHFRYLLRHQPESINLKLDKNGWALIDELIEKTVAYDLDRELVKVVVETSEKQQFAISEDDMKIRANQGHSIDIDLDLESREPPEFLLHGTAYQFLDSIKTQGLSKMTRHHVHLTESEAVAAAVSGRFSEPVILVIQAKLMHEKGYFFYRTVNNVWLTEKVPTEFIAVY